MLPSRRLRGTSPTSQWPSASAGGLGLHHSGRSGQRREHDAAVRGVLVDYHLLSDFRCNHQEAMNGLLTKIVAILMAGNLVAQDGMRVRASAGSGSFRRQSRLEECLEAAQEQVERLQEREHPDPGVSLRERTARERATRERLDRLVEYGLGQLKEIRASKERQASMRVRPARPS